MILFINACVRENSRTLRLSKYILDKLGEKYESVTLGSIQLLPLNEERLKERDNAIAQGDLQADILKYAVQFSRADTIVIAAPYWALSFPALLKIYTELICACGVTFSYNESGEPVSLCNAGKLIYVTTAGGFIPEHNFGFDYIDNLAKTFFGIRDTVYFKAEGLDIDGNDPETILNNTFDEINSIII